MSNPDATEKKLIGINGSPGICIGKAYLVDKEGVDLVEKYYITKDNLQNEINRFKAAAKNARDELVAIIDDTPEDLRQHAYILEAQVALAKDKMLYGRTIETIEKESVNAEWALKKVVSNVKKMFRDIPAPYLRERVTDIVHVSDRIMRNLVGVKDVNIADIDKRVILVAHDLSPADTSRIQLERIKGFITDRGGKASHTGIIAQTLGIPSVLGLENATDIIKTDDIIIVDGTTGLIIIHPTDETLVEYEEQKTAYEKYKAAINRRSDLPAITKDGFSLPVLGNIELPEEIVSVIDHGGDGIGLFRTEFLYLSRNNFPSENELFDRYKDVVEVMAPKPVTIRTLDIKGDKTLPYLSDPDETNPALGLRAIRFCLKRPDIFKAQLKATLRVAALGNVRLMFPMISSCEEIHEAKKHLKEVENSLKKEGVLFKSNIQIGIMIEVPSAVIMADAMAEIVDFFSIGTNDLIQYSLAIDRGNKQVAHLYNPLNPAVIRMLKHVVDVGRKKGIKVCMCGEMAGDPFNIPILLGLGINELSMNPQSIPSVKNTIRALDAKTCRLFVKEVLKMTTTEAVMNLVTDKYGDLLSK
ncbi:MAG: phosphoenolpyruvate--protein phosphotransferase [Deltaproteobacteria bacterium]|nr:phosphoenolpyruvate--protein phosphotransferase [Deltaproteobacteria bacterium]